MLIGDAEMTVGADVARQLFSDRTSPTTSEKMVQKRSPIGFDGPHNSAITWHHLVQQTSEWEGEL